MNPERPNLQADILRHGFIDQLSRQIEAGEKPEYETAVAHIEGSIDPPIDAEATEQALQGKLERGEITTADVNVIIHSPALRTQQTAELLQRMTGGTAQVRPSDLLHEVHPSMARFSRQDYEATPDWRAVRDRFVADFLEHGGVDEDAVGAYRRAERFLVYLRRIRKQTKANPAFITHGMFSRFISLAIAHEREQLTDDEIRTLLHSDPHPSKRPAILSGVRVENTTAGSKLIETI